MHFGDYATWSVPRTGPDHLAFLLSLSFNDL